MKESVGIRRAFQWLLASSLWLSDADNYNYGLADQSQWKASLLIPPSPLNDSGKLTLVAQQRYLCRLFSAFPSFLESLCAAQKLRRNHVAVWFIDRLKTCGIRRSLLNFMCYDASSSSVQQYCCWKAIAGLLNGCHYEKDAAQGPCMSRQS